MCTELCIRAYSYISHTNMKMASDIIPEIDHFRILKNTQMNSIKDMEIKEMRSSEYLYKLQRVLNDKDLFRTLPSVNTQESLINMKETYQLQRTSLSVAQL